MTNLKIGYSVTKQLSSRHQQRIQNLQKDGYNKIDLLHVRNVLCRSNTGNKLLQFLAQQLIGNAYICINTVRWHVNIYRSMYHKLLHHKLQVHVTYDVSLLGSCQLHIQPTNIFHIFSATVKIAEFLSTEKRKRKRENV